MILGALRAVMMFSGFYILQHRHLIPLHASPLELRDQDLWIESSVPGEKCPVRSRSSVLSAAGPRCYAIVRYSMFLVLSGI